MARDLDRTPSDRPRRLAAALVVGIIAGCVSTAEPPEPVEFVEPLPASDGLVEAGDGTAGRGGVDPVDVWVAPVVDATTNRGAPAEALRGELYRGLVDRLYSPLALAFGDTSVAAAREASSESAPPFGPREADAVLSVVVRGWDTGQLESRGLIDASLELRLIDLRSDPAEQRWGRRVGRRLRLEPSLLKQATPGELQDYGARTLAAEVLLLLPARDPYAVDTVDRP